MSHYPQPFPRANKSNGFTLVELLVVIVISMVIFAAIFMVMNAAECSNSIGTASLDLQQQIRGALDSLIRDLRQSGTQQMQVFNATGGLEFLGKITEGLTFSDPQFFLCDGYNVAVPTVLWGDQISYAFDPATQRLIRTNLSTIPPQQFTFNYITNIVFTKLALRQIRIDIAGQRTARRGLAGDTVCHLALSEEVRIRNE